MIYFVLLTFILLIGKRFLPSTKPIYALHANVITILIVFIKLDIETVMHRQLVRARPPL
jgi:hypothetical protein